MREVVTCRSMKRGEEEGVLALIERGFDQFVRYDFTQDGVEEFLRATRVMVFDRPRRHCLMIAECAGRIVGMIDMKEDTHVALFSVDPPYQHRGIGRQLLEHAIGACRQRKPDVAEISVHSSPWAVPICERLGFQQTKPEQECNGIRFAEMIRKLPPRSG